MTCTLAPTGPCSLTPDNSCAAPKESASLAPLEDLFIQGLDDGFQIWWNNDVFYAGQTVTLLGRIGDGASYVIRRGIDRNLGYLESIQPIPYDSEIKYWIRPETDTTYGEWQTGTLYTRSDWDNGGTPPVAAPYDVTWLSVPIYETNKAAGEVRITGAEVGALYTLTISGPRFRDGDYSFDIPGTALASEFTISNIDCSDFAVGTITASYQSTVIGVQQPPASDVVPKITDNYLHAADGSLIWDTDGNPIPISGVYQPFPFDIVEHTDTITDQVLHNAEQVIYTQT